MTESSTIEFITLFQMLEQDSLILTTNHRANVQLLEAYGQYRKQQGLTAVCVSPNIFPVDIWLQNCFDELVIDRTLDFPAQTLLDPFQELFLWKTLIRESDIGSSLLNLEGTARTVIEAYRIIQQWEIPLEEITAFSSLVDGDKGAFDDLDVFLIWLETYLSRAQQDNIVSLAQLLNQFIEVLGAGLVKLPEQIILLGFDTPPPLYQRLFKTLDEQKKCYLSRQTLKTNHPEIEKKAFNNQTQEMLAAAHWSQTTLQETPSARVGIICPDLHNRKSEVQRVFSTCFFPDQILNKEMPENTKFSSTASNNVDSLPAIQIALMLLRLNEHTLPTLDICQLLRSPFLLGAEIEADQRAALEYKLRKNFEINTRLSNLRYLALEKEKSWYCPVLGQALLDFETCRQQHKAYQSLSKCSGLIEKQLALIIDQEFWEQEKSLSQWYELLKKFNNMSYLCQTIKFSEAIDLLEQMARNTNATIFFNQASVKILAPVEASGLQFTHLWFMGLSETNWPPPARSNPFLPIQIQLKYNTPAASAGIQYLLAKEMLQAFYSASSVKVVFSYPLQADAIALKPSRLLEAFSAKTAEQNSQELESNLHAYSLRLFTLAKDKDAVEVLNDTLNIPLLENEETSGGTALIADQAACPFKSFAKYRLQASELPKVAYGLPPYAVGNMLHHAMEVFWQTLKDQQSIDAMDAVELDKLVQKAASAGVKQISRHFPETMNVRYCELEVLRLSELLKQWLDEERKRGFFKVVEHEYALQWQYARLNLNFRIDRLEQFDDSSFGLVDYKTSKNNSVNWFDERQDKPQLLLYLLAAEKDPKIKKVSSLLYAQINIEDMKYRGIAENSATYPGTDLTQQRNFPKTITWEELREFWQHSLEALAQEFLDGYLAVEPKSASSCQYCHLGSLCRIQEQGLY